MSAPTQEFLEKYRINTTNVYAIPLDIFRKLDIKRWKYNRPPTEARISEIHEWNAQFNRMDGLLNLAYIPGEGLVCFEGNHRRLALKDLDRPITVLVDILWDVTDEVVMHEFRRINKSVSVPDLYVVETESSLKVEIEEFVKWFKRIIPPFKKLGYTSLASYDQYTMERSEAEKSAEEWMPYIKEWLICAILDPEQHRDIGKLLANASEIVVRDRISEMSGVPNQIVVGKSYDMSSETIVPVRTQSKFRMSDWHLETTRRNSAKNSDTNSTGHVAYRHDEFDMLAVFVPGPAFAITGSRIRCIPSTKLVNSSKPHQLITRIPASMKREYDDDKKAAEVIRSMFQISS